MKSKIIFLLFGFFVLVSFSCAQENTKDEISVKQLKEAMKNDSTLVILDVRTALELEGPYGKIEGVVNIPVQELENRIGELEKNKDKNIAVICRSGSRSAKATSFLLEKGFKAKNVVGGMLSYYTEE